MRVTTLAVFGAAGWLLCGGCGLWVQPEIPSELSAVLDNPEFAETADVVHKGSLDDLEGCWGSYGTNGVLTDAVFHRLDSGSISSVWYSSYQWFGVIGMVYGEEGDYEIAGADTITVTITRMYGSDPETGLLTDVELMEGDEEDTTVVRNYEIALDGDSMTIYAPDVNAQQYEGTFWRFAECP